MFDPTIYENIKVVFEGEIYEQDLAGEITIIDRQDVVNLAGMNRSYHITFRLNDSLATQSAKIKLDASTEDLAKEILESTNDEKPGCEVIVYFYSHIKSIEECGDIQDKLNEIWDYRPQVTQTLSFKYNEKVEGYFNEISLSFGRKIDEDNIGDIHHLLEYTIISLKELSKFT